MRLARFSARVLSVVWSLCCATPTPPPGWTERLAEAPPTPPGDDLPAPPAELERLMRADDLEIGEVEPAGSGVMGALRLEIHYASAGRTLAFKWKKAPGGGEGWNNTPRRELAAYEIQKWFLDPADYVVPPTVARCIPLEAYAAIEEEATPNLPGVECIFGTLSIWLDGLEEPDPLLDLQRFYREPGYARPLANYNLLTFLIQNRDTRTANVLVSHDRFARRVYSVDNGITFGELIHNFFVTHWNRIRVPAIPGEAVERLRRIDEDDLAELLVVGEFRRDAAGVLRQTSPSTPFQIEEGARMRAGVLQLGLEPAEIDGVRERLNELIEAVERGDIPVF